MTVIKGIGYLVKEATGIEEEEEEEEEGYLPRCRVRKIQTVCSEAGRIPRCRRRRRKGLPV